MVQELVFFCLLSCCLIATADDTDRTTVALSGDSASGLAIALLIVSMIVFGVKMMLSVEISDAADELSDK